jgi:ABC-2 type transport system permease protein
MIMLTTVTLPRPSRAARTRRAWRILTGIELKLLIRTPAALFWGIGFPVIGLIVLGAIPGTGKPVKSLGGVSVLETYLPIIITFMIIMTSVNFLPATLASYRERGVLRRMFTTPVTPQVLLSADLALTLGTQVATTALIVVLAVGAFTASIGAPLAFIVAFLLLAAAASTLGLLVAAVSLTTKAANALGAVLFFVLMFFSGLWLPRAEMPDWLRGISDATLTGSGVQAVQNAMAGHWASGLFFGVLVAWIVVCGALAIRFFRWE